MQHSPLNQSDIQAALDVLASASLFKDVPENVRRDVVSASRQISLQPGQILFGRGQPGSAMYVVVKGTVEISLSTEEGRKLSLNFFGEGHCFGEISMLDGGERSADAVALSSTLVLAINRDAFLKTARDHPDLAIALARMLSERVRWISDTVEDYTLLSLERRLARRVLILFDRFGKETGVIGISQSDLADFVGATRESTNKILADWRKRGWIDIGRKTIALKDRAALAAMVNSPAAAP